MARIGSRHMIKLVDESPVFVNGEATPNAETILFTWANVRDVSGSRSVQNDQTNLEKLFEFTFRYRGDLTLNANVKVVYDGRRLTVQSLEKQLQKKFYWILQARVKSFS